MKLNGKLAAALVLGDKNDVIYFDDSLRGFGIRLRRSRDGRRVLRSWVAQYRRGGVSRRLRLGSTEVLSAIAARTAAREVLAKVALGGDPVADRRTVRQPHLCPHCGRPLSDSRSKRNVQKRARARQRKIEMRAAWEMAKEFGLIEANEGSE
jgi:Arm DNA-binding domain